MSLFQVTAALASERHRQITAATASPPQQSDGDNRTAATFRLSPPLSRKMKNSGSFKRTLAGKLLLFWGDRETVDVIVQFWNRMRLLRWIWWVFEIVWQLWVHFFSLFSLRSDLVVHSLDWNHLQVTNVFRLHSCPEELIHSHTHTHTGILVAFRCFSSSCITASLKVMWYFCIKSILQENVLLFLMLSGEIDAGRWLVFK